MSTASWSRKTAWYPFFLIGRCRNALKIEAPRVTHASRIFRTPILRAESYTGCSNMTGSDLLDNESSCSENHSSENVGQYHSSILYSLTRPLRNRLRRLTSSRDIEDIDSAAETSIQSSRRSSNDMTFPRSPPPVYTSKVSLCWSEADSETEREEQWLQMANSRKRRRPVSNDNDIFDAQFSAATESKSGIRWKYGNQGSLPASNSQMSVTDGNQH
jgi:hypothetical protein